MIDKSASETDAIHMVLLDTDYYFFPKYERYYKSQPLRILPLFPAECDIFLCDFHYLRQCGGPIQGHVTMNDEGHS